MGEQVVLADGVPGNPGRPVFPVGAGVAVDRGAPGFRTALVEEDLEHWEQRKDESLSSFQKLREREQAGSETPN